MSVVQKPGVLRTAKVLATGSASAATTQLIHAIPLLAPYAPVLNGLSTVAAEWLCDVAERLVTEQSASKSVFQQMPSMAALEGALALESLTEVLRRPKFNRDQSAQIFFGIKYSSPLTHTIYRDNLCRIIINCWETDVKLARKAAAVLTGVALLTKGLGDFESNLKKLVQKAIALSSFEWRGVCESLCFIFGVYGDEDVYRSFLRIVVSNRKWRYQDALDDVVYCGGLDKALMHRLSHLEQRASQGFASGHDTGRSIQLLTSLPKAFKDTSVGIRLREATLESLNWNKELKSLAKIELDTNLH